MGNSFKNIFTRIPGELSEIAVNGFNKFFSFDGIKSVEGVANQPKMGRGESNEGHWPGALESAQYVDAGWSCHLSPAEIQSSDGQNIFVRYDTCAQKYFQ